MLKNPVLGSLGNQTGESFIQKALPAGIGWLLVAGGLFFVFMMLWGGVTWILSGGDKAGVEASRGRITNALVGLVLLLSTFAVVKLVETFFGIDILTIDMGPLVIE